MNTVDAPVLTRQNEVASTIVYNGAASDNPTQKNSSPTTQTTWLGRENCDWDNPDNWSNGVPGTCNHAYIPSTTNEENFPIISGNLMIDFTIKISGKLFIEGSVELRLEAMIQNEGILEVMDIGALINEGKIYNNETFLNNGTVINKGLITNGGSFINDGNLDNEASIINLDEILNSGFVDSDTPIINNGVIESLNSIDYHL